MKKRKLLNVKLLSVLGIIAVVLLVGVLGTIFSFNDHSYSVKITDKERVYDSKSKVSKYMIYAENKDSDDLVFENTDDFFRLKFNSSNMYSELKVGKTYNITVVGYRVPFLSMYENIIKVEE